MEQSLNKEDQKTMESAVAYYGAFHQTQKGIEELSELIRALARNTMDLDSEDARTNLIEEIADVEIMLFQICFAYNIQVEVQTVKHEKLKRLRDRISSAINVERV